MLIKNGSRLLLNATGGILRKMGHYRYFRKSPIIASKSLKVAILGCTGRTGRCLSLFLKQSALIDELALYDIKSIRGLAMELNCIDTNSKVNYSETDEPSLKEVLEDAKIVMITAGKSYSSTSPNDDILYDNALILAEIFPEIVKYCPDALIGMTMNPVNSLIPMAAEMLKMAGITNLNRLFGVTTINSIRANTMTADILGVDPECVVVPIIGGNCPKTCVPLFSSAKPCNSFTHEEIGKLTHGVRNADQDFQQKYPEVENSLHLMEGYAAARFCMSLCKALRDQTEVVECAYVRSCVIPEVTYFASPLRLGPCGIQMHLGVPPLSDSECKLLEVAVPELREAIKIGETLALGTEDISSEICPPDPEPCAERVYSSENSKTPPTTCAE
ncbi:malate dehydrogenase, mitochondrial-like [Leptopilina heterotoma]|uniref:malate dehydrogenase, mitochondrial-like n=1 Tax=Leptopilina heterotoma TaxID=63436 RepID=UPI001CA7D51E|nr:malate dehydrogenase, mitochondrial-like [Leptopilina heterotoma]XP_043481349.1 malate dehydrogenase, mitochondrial-like [Leptopilina heterotoma]